MKGPSPSLALQSATMRALLISFCLLLGGENLRASEDKMRTVHKRMSGPELGHHFDVHDVADVDPDSYQVILVKRHEVVNKRDGSPLNHDAAISMKAFGKDYQLRLKRNSHLVSDYIESVTIDHDGNKHQTEFNTTKKNCHYKILDASLVGGISDCSSRYRGFVLDDKEVLDLTPLSDKIHREHFEEEPTDDFRYHIIRKSAFIVDENPHGAKANQDDDIDRELLIDPEDRKPRRQNINLSNPKLDAINNILLQKRNNGENHDMKMEIALFVDKPACDNLDHILEEDRKMRDDVILALVNCVQALFHHTSLHDVIYLTIVRMEYHDGKTPFETHDGLREPLLKSFCAYQQKMEPGDDTVPQHWDNGLFLSGLDFYALKRSGDKTFGTMGLSTVTGTCTDKYNCIISEVAVHSKNKRSYPSTGFTVIYILAHEIGHNLGMFHDHSDLSADFYKCDAQGFMMSPTRGMIGEVTWSKCSADYLAALDLECLEDTPAEMQTALDHNKFDETPGRVFTPEQQCIFYFPGRKDIELGFTDKKDWPSMCDKTLMCKSQDIIEAVGPALPGTPCKEEKDFYCLNGKCEHHVFGNEAAAKEPKWTDWESTSKCHNTCVEGAMGYKQSRRRCLRSQPMRSGKSCPGRALKSELCGDFDKNDEHCPSNLYTMESYATALCEEWTGLKQVAKKFDPVGRQGAVDPDFSNNACLVECKEKGKSSFSSPVQELAGSGESPYYPDGVVCAAGKHCVQHRCVRQSTRSGRTSGDAKTVTIVQSEEPEEDTEMTPPADW